MKMDNPFSHDEQAEREANAASVDRLKRVAAIVVAILFGILSIEFSKRGLVLKSEDTPFFVLAGYVIAIAFTVIEFVFNSGTEGNTTLFLAGLAVYAYSIYTNILGLGDMVGATGSSEVWDWVIPFLFGIILDILPEPLLLWGLRALTGDSQDFIGRILGLGRSMVWRPERGRGYSYPGAFNNRSAYTNPKENNAERQRMIEEGRRREREERARREREERARQQQSKRGQYRTYPGEPNDEDEATDKDTAWYSLHKPE